MKNNYVRLEGFVGFAPRMTTFENDRSVTRFSLATTDKLKTSDGKLIESKAWHNIVIWSDPKMPDFSQVQKGSHLTIEGRLKPTVYSTKDGQDIRSYEVVAAKVKVH